MKNRLKMAMAAAEMLYSDKEKRKAVRKSQKQREEERVMERRQSGSNSKLREWVGAEGEVAVSFT